MKKAKLIIDSILIIVGIIILANLAMSSRNKEGTDVKKESETTLAEEDFEEELPSQGSEDLILMLEDNQFWIGEESEGNAVLWCSDSITGEVSLTDENGEEVASVNIEGAGSYTVPFSVNTQTERVGSLYASQGDSKSNSVSFYVQPHVTEDMMLALIDVAENLDAYAKSLETEDYYSEENIQKVKIWLEENEKVGAVLSGDGYILYMTTDGMAGSYGLGQYEEGYLGKKTSIESAVAAYKDNQDLSDYFVESKMTMTNNKTVLMIPDYAGKEESDDLSVNSLKGCAARLAEQTGGSVMSIEGDAVTDLLLDGTYTDSGLWEMNTHGTLVKRSDGSDMLYFQLGSLGKQAFMSKVSGGEGGNWGDLKTYKQKNTMFDCFFAGKTNDVYEVRPENYRLVYDVTEGNEDVYRVLGTSALIEYGLQDNVFDNTVIHFLVCDAASDQRLLDAFKRHGAAAFAGCVGNYAADYSLILNEELLKELGKEERSSEEKTAFEQWLHIAQLNDTKEYKDCLDLAYRDGGVPDTSHLLDELCQTSLEKMRGVTSDEIAHIYSFRDKRFTMGEKGKMTGAVVTNEGKPVKGAEVSLYRWLDHSFQKEGTVYTDEEGSYVAENINYGIYLAEASFGINHGYITMEFNQANDTMRDIVLELKGGITGKVIDKDTGEPVEGASVQYTINDSTTGVLTNQDGYFLAENLEPGTYSIFASKKKYVDSDSVQVTVSEGELAELEEPIYLEKPRWQEAYAEVARNYQANLNGLQAKFGLAYIDKDDIPELILDSGDGHICKVTLYTYYNKQPVLLGENYGDFGVIGYTPRTGTIIEEVFANGGYYLAKFYALTEGTATQEMSFMHDVNQVNYTVNDQAVSKEQYDKEWANWAELYDQKVKREYATLTDINDASIAVLLSDDYSSLLGPGESMAASDSAENAAESETTPAEETVNGQDSSADEVAAVVTEAPAEESTEEELFPIKITESYGDW